jgi:hypothetical protein
MTWITENKFLNNHPDLSCLIIFSAMIVLAVIISHTKKWLDRRK